MIYKTQPQPEPQPQLDHRVEIISVIIVVIRDSVFAASF